jgi:hypothetical protein
LAVLNACLVNGFGSQSVDSIVVSGGIAIVTRAAGHSFEQHQVAKIAGATPSGLNGEKKVLTTTATSYTFDATGISDQTATGTITHSVAALGWTKPFADSGNVGVFKSSNVESTGHILRVDDSGAQVARARAYESMSSLSVGTFRYPEDNVVSGGYYWPRSAANDAGSRGWMLFGDDRMFFLAVAYYSSSPTMYAINCAFGDYLPARPSGTAYSCILHGATTTSSYNTSPGNSWDLPYLDTSTAQFLSTSRTYQGVAGPGYARRVWNPLPTSLNSGSHHSGNGGGQYPNPVDNGIYVSPMVLWEGSGPYIGHMPGIYCTSQTISGVFSSQMNLRDAVGLPGNRILKAVCSSTTSFAFFDITGPWR